MQRINSFLLAVTISLLFVVAGLVHALKQHPPYAPQINTEQQSDAAFKRQDHAKSAKPKAVSANQIDRRENPEQAYEEGSEFWPPLFGLKLKITDSLIALFNLGLFIFTGLLWNSTEKLFKAGENQLRLIRRTALIQFRDMQDSITAAQQSADAAVGALGSDRAWLSRGTTIRAFVQGLVIDGEPAGNGLMLGVQWLNTGRSPAINVNVFTWHRLAFPNEPIPTFEPEILGPIIRGRATIGPGQNGQGVLRAISEADYARLQNRELVVWLYSRVDYEDVFNAGVPRYTETCARIEFNGEEIVDGRGVPRMNVFPQGPQNSAS
jgi:hypothetical protein